MRTTLSIAVIMGMTLATPGHAAAATGAAMTRARIASLLCCALACSLSVAARAQSPPLLRLSPCREGRWMFLPVGVKVTGRRTFVPGQRIDRVRIQLPWQTTAEVVERPKSGAEEDDYNSIIVTRQGARRHVTSVGILIEGGKTLRLVEVGSVCRSPDSGLLLLEFGSPSTAMYEGFVVVQYSSRSLTIHGLPLARQARVVLWSGDDSHLEIWSGSEEAATPIDCDACPRYYSILRCSITARKAHCKFVRKTPTPLSPDKFMGHRIKIVTKKTRRR